ncbi:thymidylate kinase [Plasmodium reichenowi]|uniref:Thymidylate kinase n=9 Tax=Plasmodium (Laverania) TaxID=418107 RepID=KTHY_PLAF7|nr:thymidylate kinase [Plasmodium falciparum 3D7]XP_019970278.1 thymidylate kinase [Plasmodium reichenowi]Q8I4S1.1 RecName: Full=Thymidylate kinase; Short=PfTMK; Short=PfTMPK; AltName: Full=Thymidine monophosphate kinase; AltName: Full=Thymidylate/guanylate kinase [Plasmodium falciparum 3D7]2YOF_A Chain A, THYMIDYLATE KINASE [Plasmodium falciparum 3D7]2YOF_B Chain B, THYMIDYLATE KINASE [Plasmodium falciparum 3D7]2YOF_C Chain C, THYMIDYLATE KINASE [Plasmodium falciparum 3D7]2YOG_A Chain A, Thy|eukprot:XP_001350897.1 thymidylate kinase [Plasmodium falciparum 3D7]
MTDDKKKGKFIVFEGLDRSGKSTQSKLLVEYLKNNNVEVKHLYFPNRETGIGQIISKYLKMENSMSNETIHLLFSANRWEHMNEIKSLLLKGIWVVCDRYAYSGVAYSSGALNLNKTWCMNPDQGLIKPDVVFYLNVPPNYAQNRSDYGEEIYEKVETQKKIYETYKHFAHEDYWINIDATRKIEDIHNDIVKEVTKIKVEPEEFNFLWS